VKRICRYLPLLSLLPFCVPFASGQSSVDFMMGFGTAHDASNGQGTDSYLSINGFGAPCTPGSGDTNCLTNPALSGFFLGFGMDAMLWKHLGIGGEFMGTPARSNYGSPCSPSVDEVCLQYRQEFYDFNAILAPVNTKRMTFEVQGGIGGAHTGFAANEAGSCVGAAIACTGAQAQPYVSANHFQIHVGVGLSIFITEHIFIRPQFDLHYVPGFGGPSNEFNSNLVPAGTVWVGYNFGERQ